MYTCMCVCTHAISEPVLYIQNIYSYIYARTVSVLKTLFHAFEVLRLHGFESCVGHGAGSAEYALLLLFAHSHCASADGR